MCLFILKQVLKFNPNATFSLLLWGRNYLNMEI